MINRAVVLTMVFICIPFFSALAGLPDMQYQLKALVIGNAAYAELSLSNPVTDAKTVAKTLEKVGAEVTTGFDLDRKSFESKLESFSSSLRKNDIVFFYYAGTAINQAGENFIFPVDYKFVKYPANLSQETISLKKILGRFQQKKPSLTVILYDAASGGIASAGDGSPVFLLFAGMPGQPVMDGDKMGPFASAVVQAMQPGTDLDSFARLVISLVMKEPDCRQIPMFISNYSGNFIFNKAEQ